MNLRNINGKRVVDEKIVMTEPVIRFLEGVDVMVEHVVSQREQGRPDLVALKYYGDHSLTDLILKFNGISNPFVMTEGETIEIPIKQERYVKIVKPNRDSGESAKEKFIKQRRMTKKDIKRLEYLQQIAEKEALPPNRLKSGQFNKDVDSGPITDLNGNLFNQ